MKAWKIGLLYPSRVLGKALANKLSLPLIDWTIRSMVRACSEIKQVGGTYRTLSPVPMMDIFVREPGSGVINGPSFMYPYIWASMYGYPETNRKAERYFGSLWKNVVESYDWVVTVPPVERDGGYHFPIDSPALMAHAAVALMIPERTILIDRKKGETSDVICEKIVLEIVNNVNKKTISLDKH